MIIIWTGRGVYGAIPLLALPTICLVTAATCYESQHNIQKVIPFFTDDFAKIMFGILFCLGPILGGTICWFLGRSWNRLRNDHTIYFVPVHYWGLVSIAAGLVPPILIVVGLVYLKLASPN